MWWSKSHGGPDFVTRLRKVPPLLVEHWYSCAHCIFKNDVLLQNRFLHWIYVTNAAPEDLIAVMEGPNKAPKDSQAKLHLFSETYIGT